MKILLCSGEYKTGHPYAVPRIWIDGYAAMGWEVILRDGISSEELIELIPQVDALAIKAHGTSTWFYTKYGDMFRPADIPANHLIYVHLYACDGGEWDSDGTWANVFVNNGAVFVSYDDMPDIDGNYTQNMLWAWQADYLDLLVAGYTISAAFDKSFEIHSHLRGYFVPKVFGKDMFIKLWEGKTMAEKIQVVSINQVTAECDIEEFVTSDDAEAYIGGLSKDDFIMAFKGCRLTIEKTGVNLKYQDPDGEWVDA